MSSTATISTISIDCSGNPVWGDGQCDTACGADASCDGRTPGTCSSEEGYKCNSNCDKVADSGCVTCKKDCINAKNIGIGSISTGGYEASYTCSIDSVNSEEWLKITANSNGKLKIDLTPPTGSDYDLRVYANDCSTYLCSSAKTGNAVDSCIIDAAAGAAYRIKALRYSGSGKAEIRAYLEECYTDANCPSAKPYCNNKKCVECLENDNFNLFKERVHSIECEAIQAFIESVVA